MNESKLTGATKESVLTAALQLPFAVADHPFEGDFTSTVLRHGEGGKWFGLIMRVPREKVGTGSGEVDILNLKCLPEDGITARTLYAGIVPAYHMNKVHWVSVLLDGSVPCRVVEELLVASYTLTAPKKRTLRH